MRPAETRNPWNPNHTPGGSSAGSAAAVAAGFVHATIGSQTNGSVIRPAAYCGVVGYKPTSGLLPFAGGLAFSPTLDQVGTFARTIADVALFTGTLAEEGVPTHLERRAKPPMLGIIVEYPWTLLEPEAKEHFNATVNRLATAGAQVRALELPAVFDDAHLVHRTIMLHEGAKQHRERQAAHRALLSEPLNDSLDEGRRISSATYGEMLGRRAALIEAAHVFDDCDAILSPPAPNHAPRRLDTTGDPSFCTLWSLLGFPAVTVPSGLAAAGVPYGMQLAANAGADRELLVAAQWVEGVLGPLQRGE